jgi:hypothetical protein
MGKLIDLTNRKVGDWIVLRREKTEKSKYHYWRCRCKCGFEKCFTSTHIQFGLKGGCGCDLTLVGQRFGMLMPIERIAKTGYTNSKYLCRCDCGNTKILRAIILTKVKQKSCGCAVIKRSEDTGVRIALNTYRRHAKKRKLEFSLEKKDFRDLILSKCYYCDGGFTNTTKENYRTKKEKRVFFHNGVDRVNNSKGYTKENSVACCSACNLMKREFSVQKWIEHMKKVLNNIKTKPKEAI